MTKLNLSAKAACRDFLLGFLIFKGLTARRFYKSIGVKGLSVLYLSENQERRVPLTS
jgi:hypothetical protein